MRISAPAKINLHLRVGSPRADGFHPLLTWMCTVALFDKLTLDPTPGDEIQLACDDPAVPRGAQNLVSMAAAAFADVLAHSSDVRAGERFGLSVRLHKRIPVGAGLAGGSSDGACALQALNILWNAGWGRQKLADFAARFGSDLSFFFFAPSAICRGRGEIVRPIERPKPTFAVLILPPLAMPTPAVYRKFDEMKLGSAATIEVEPDSNGWTKLDALALLPLLVNDLETPAFAIEPKLGDLRRNVEQITGRCVRMSGSGSSLYTLYDEEAEAQAAAQFVAQRLQIRTIAAPLAPVCGIT